MKISSAPAPIKRSAAMNCLLVNQLATPGLGSLMGRRFVEGTVQLSLALLGFLLIIGWFVEMALSTYRFATTQVEQHDANPWMGKLGGILFATSWLLSWITSMSLLRNSTPNSEPPQIKPPPPRPQPPILKN